MTTLPDRYRLPKKLKRTTKYTDQDRAQVKKLHAEGYSIRHISRVVGMSRRLVQFTLYPERLAHARQLFKKRQQTGRYRYPTEKQSAMVAETRKRKRAMLKQGVQLEVKNDLRNTATRLIFENVKNELK